MDHHSFPNSLPFPQRLISQPRPLICFAFRSSGPHSPVPSGTSESPSSDLVPIEARLHCPLLFLPNPKVPLLFLPLQNLSLSAVSEALAARVFTVPLLPLRSPSPHSSAFTSQEPVSSRPVPFLPLSSQEPGSSQSCPSQTVFSQVPENSHLFPFPKSRLEPGSPQPRLLGAPIPSVPSQESSQSCLNNLPLQTLTHCGSGS